MLGVDGDRPLVVVQHREVEAVDPRDVTQLAACDVPFARALDLDHVAPIQARSCVQVGPDCTWVKSRMRTRLMPYPFRFPITRP